jgi:hypothetical protein
MGWFFLTDTLSVTSLQQFQPEIERIDLSCYGESTGSITLDGLIQTVEWNTGETSASIVDLIAGSYTYTILDINGCVSSEEIHIEQPSQLDAVLTTSDVLCYGDNSGNCSIDSITGGIGESDILFEGDLDFLLAGSYEVMIVDSNDCIAIFDFEIDQPDSLYGTIETSVAFENDGTAELSVFGGVGPYVVEWSTGESGEIFNVDELGAGDYWLSVSDVHGCVFLLEFEIDQWVGLNVHRDDLIVVYPNPFSEILNIEGLEGGGDYHIRLIGSDGRLVRSERLEHHLLKLDNILPGIYLLEIFLEDNKVHAGRVEKIN